MIQVRFNKRNRNFTCYCWWRIYKEVLVKTRVVNAVMAHHNEVEFETIEAILVQAADVSASRPGARRETLTAILRDQKILKKLLILLMGLNHHLLFKQVEN